jgi:hypothetical protein
MIIEGETGSWSLGHLDMCGQQLERVELSQGMMGKRAEKGQSNKTRSIEFQIEWLLNCSSGLIP